MLINTFKLDGSLDLLYASKDTSFMSITYAKTIFNSYENDKLIKESLC